LPWSLRSSWLMLVDVAALYMMWLLTRLTSSITSRRSKREEHLVTIVAIPWTDGI
jgi:hypothetical protein